MNGEELYALYALGYSKQNCGVDAWDELVDSDRDVWEGMAEAITDAAYAIARKSGEAVPHAKELLGDASAQVFVNQLLMALVMQSGGKATIPVDVVDGTGGYMMNMTIEADRVFTLQVVKKQ